jgi:iron complex outermembrane receptor protein
MRKIETKDLLNEEGSFEALSKTYTGFTYSAGGVYSFEKIKLRSNISSGFRAPNTSELLSNGTHEGTNRYEIGNTQLKNEKATQIDFSVEREGEHFDISVNAFYNNIADYIFLSPEDTLVNNDPVFTYQQTNAFL